MLPLRRLRRNKRGQAGVLAGLFILILSLLMISFVSELYQIQSQMSEYDASRAREKIEISDVFFGGTTQYSPDSLTPPGGDLASLKAIDDSYVEFDGALTDRTVRPVSNMNFSQGADGWYFRQTLGSMGITYGYEGGDSGSIYAALYGAGLGPYWMNWTCYFSYTSGLPQDAYLSWRWLVMKHERIATGSAYVIVASPNGTMRAIQGPFNLTTLNEGEWYLNTAHLDTSIFSTSGTYSLVLAVLGQTKPGLGFPPQLFVFFDDVGVSLTLGRVYSSDFQGSFTVNQDPKRLRRLTLWYTGHYISTSSIHNPTSATSLGETSVISGDYTNLASKDGSFLALRSYGSSTSANPSSLSLLGNTTLESGSLGNLASDDGSYLRFKSYVANSTIEEGSEGWWNPNYAYRRKLAIANNNPTVPMPVKFTVSFAVNTQEMISSGKLQGDGDDFRVVWWNSSSSSWLELDRLNVTNFGTAATTIRFRTQVAIPGGSFDDNYCTYYGYAGATNPPSNGSNVYFFEDLFNRAASSTVGSGWVEYESGGADARIASNPLVTTNVLDLYSRNGAMDTIAQHSVAGLTNRSVWEFGFVWDRDSLEGHYEVYMQLGDSSMSQSSPWNGVSVFLSWCGTGSSTTIGRPASRHEMMRVFDDDQVPTEIEVVSGGADIRLDMNLAAGNYRFYRDEVYKGTYNVYRKLSACNTIRFVADRLTASSIVKRGIDYIRIYLAVDPAPSVNTGSEEYSEYVAEVEFAGTDNTYDCEWLNWTVDAAWTVDAVEVTLQLYNFTAGQYSTGGDGYISRTSGTASNDETYSQLITTDPSDFRNAAGEWRIKIKGSKKTVAQFSLLCDLVEFRTDAYDICDWRAEFAVGDYSALDQIDISYWGYYGDSSINQTMYIYNYETSRYEELGSTVLYAASGVGQWHNKTIGSGFEAYVNSSTVRMRILASKDSLGRFDCYADLFSLELYWISSTVTQQLYIMNFGENEWSLLRTSNIGSSDETEGPAEIAANVEDYIGPSGIVIVRVRGESEYPFLCCRANYMLIRVYYKDYSGITLKIANTGSETAKLTALWINNSTLHSRVELVPGDNLDYAVLSPGQSAIIEARYPHSVCQYTFKIVTERGTIALYVKTSD